MSATPARSLKLQRHSPYNTPERSLSKFKLHPRPLLRPNTPAKFLIAKRLDLLEDTNGAANKLSINEHSPVCNHPQAKSKPDKYQCLCPQLVGNCVNQLVVGEANTFIEDAVDFAGELYSQKDVDLAKERIENARESWNTLRVQADIVKEELFTKLMEVKGIQNKYDGVVEQIASLEREIGKWRTLLAASGDCTNLPFTGLSGA
jgi:hypothetical protein